MSDAYWADEYGTIARGVGDGGIDTSDLDFYVGREMVAWASTRGDCVKALFTAKFHHEAGLPTLTSLDREFPHDGTEAGRAAAKREAMRYIEMTWELES